MPDQSDVSAVVLSIGEPYTARAIASVRAQTLPVRDAIVIENVTPFHRALNEGAHRVATPFFVQVDSDMILDADCVEALRAAMTEDVGITIGELRDPMLGAVVGIKLFRTECLRQIAMRDTISPDTDLVSDLQRAGWRTVFLGAPAGDENQAAEKRTYGEHRPDYTPAYTYRKFLLEGRRCRYRGAYGALWWRFQRLDELAREDPQRARIAAIAQMAAAIGFFLPTLTDGLAPVRDDPQLDRLLRLLDSEQRQDDLTRDILPLDRNAAIGRVFRRYAAAGHAMSTADAGLTFRETFAALRGPRADVHAVVARLALCHGVFAADRSRRARAVALLAVRKFLVRGIRQRGDLAAVARASLYRVLGRVPGFGAARRWLRPYDRAVAFLQQRSFDSMRPPRRRANEPRVERVAYVLLRYPGLTDTFVRREVQALRDLRLDLEVFARESAREQGAEDPPPGPVAYYGPMDERAGRRAWRQLARTKPATAARLALFVLRHPYRIEKTWWRDRDVLYEAARLADMLAQRGITRVHAPWADHSALLSLVASRLLAIPFSVQARASEIHRTSERVPIADRLRFADFIITNSRYNERFLASALPDDAPPVHVIYNGVDLPRFDTGATPERHAPPRLLAVGRLVEPKGFRYLLLACRLLRDEGCAFTCEIIGGPRDPDDTVTWVELRKLHTALGLESTVTFRGAQPLAAVLAAYRRSDVFVLPCVRARSGSHDITPNALIEAMAMKLAVVSTTSGAIPEIVEDGVDGVLVEPNDERALAGAIRGLLDDPERRRALGEAARRKVVERFDIARNVRDRLALFQPSAQ